MVALFVCHSQEKLAFNLCHFREQGPLTHSWAMFFFVSGSYAFDCHGLIILVTSQFDDTDYLWLFPSIHCCL